MRGILRTLIGTVGLGVAINLVSAELKIDVRWSVAMLLALFAALAYVEWDKVPVDGRGTDDHPVAPLEPTPPAPPIRFVSPGSVMERLRHALTGSADGIRSVSLWGMSGIGKTTLARMIANETGLFPGGVFWGDLRVERDLVPLLEGWLLRGGLNVGPRPAAELVDRVRQLLRVRAAAGRVLVVLDDVSADVAAMLPYVERLLTPGASLLITTQDRPLAIRHTADVIEVPLLSDDEAYNLFHRICGAPRDDAVEQILRIAQGQPLAITIAANQAAVVIRRADGVHRLAADIAANVAGALAETEGMPGVTSTALVAYRRLARPLRRAFRAAGALAEGPFTAEDVAVLLRLHALPGPLQRLLLAVRSPFAAVGFRPLVPVHRRRATTRAHLEVLTYLALVTVEGDGYSIHPVLRSFSRTQDRRRRFRVVFRRFCVAYSDAHANGTEYSMIALERQRRNLLAATREAHVDRRWSDVVALVQNLNSPEHPFLETRGLPHDERETLTLGVDAARRLGDTLTVADFTGNLAIRLAGVGRLDEAADGYRTAEALYQKLRKPSQVALARFHQARIAHKRGDLEEAERLYWLALRTSTTDTPAPHDSRIVGVLGWLVRRMRGEDAASRFHRQVGTDHERHNVGMESQAYEYLGLLAEERGDTAEAGRLFAAAADRSVRNRRRTHQFRNLGHIARLSLAAGNSAEAEETLQSMVGHLPEIAYPADYARAAESAARLAAALGHLDQGRALLRDGLRAVERLGGVGRAAAATALAQYLLEHYSDTDRDEAEQLAREALEFYDANPGMAADAVADRHVLASLRLQREDYDGAYAELALAAQAARQANRLSDLLVVQQQLWPVEQGRGRLAHAAAVLGDCVELAGRLHRPDALADAQLCLAEIELQRGRTESARLALEQLTAAAHDQAGIFGVRVLAARVQLAVNRMALDEAAAHADELGRQADAGGDPAARILAADQLVSIARVRGDTAAALAALDSSDGLTAAGPADPATQAVRLANRAVVELDRTRLATATTLIGQAARAATRHVPLRTWLTEVAADVDRVAGRWDAAIEAYRGLERVHARAGSIGGRVAVAINLGDIAVRGHDPSSALVHVQLAQTLGAQAGLILPIFTGHVLLASAHQQLGDLPAARLHATTALLMARRSGSPLLLAQAHICLARQAVHERRFKLAATHLARLRHAASVTKLNHLRMSLLDVSGRLAQERGDPAGARAHHEKGLLLSRRLGTAAEEVEALTCLAEADRAQGDAPAAKERYREALARMDALGAAARCWRDQVLGSVGEL
ncbi:NB-ARC domain-containing protein [Dactylosporangium sp. NPDC048998]|uniref:NB-ARC domain-containing protein n=1 Tax=Dactylosporangium sp. NPDC048998 TaxID=3363976 RepID=UPI00371D686F